MVAAISGARFVASLAGRSDRRNLKLAMSREREISTLVTGDVSIFALIRIFKSRVLGHIHQVNHAGGTVALLGDNDFRLIFGFGIFAAVILTIVVAVAMDEGDHVGILLDGTGFAQVGEHGLLVAAALLTGAAELGEGNDGDTHFFCESF